MLTCAMPHIIERIGRDEGCHPDGVHSYMSVRVVFLR